MKSSIKGNTKRNTAKVKSAKPKERKSGAELIAQERIKQMEAYGRDAEYDSTHNSNGQLVEGAAYILSQSFAYPGPSDDDCPNGWDSELWIKMLAKPEMERLIIAGALIAAEIDRLQHEQ